VAGAAHRIGRGMAATAAAALAAEYVPALATLGQWTGLDVLPGELCRWRGPRFPARVALTFDDGPHPAATPAILDRLDELGLPATFFPLASLAERDAGTVAEMARRGHAVGAHGYRHEHHLLRSPGWVRRDLDAADRVMGTLGIVPSWYRPAYGQATAATLLAARARGWRTVLWSAWGREWTTSDPADVAARIARRLRPGAIVLLHDNDAFGPPGMWRVGLAALELVAAELERRRLRAVTLDELVA
jgi:peptidoglycan-N-acetylglucosamine deacetylase